jgi:LuxR family maltose regulon positive regulatory protein
MADEVASVLEEARAAIIPDSVRAPISPAELEVLRLLATDLSQRQIGEKLFLSLNTVKTHVTSVYRKLGVSSREEANARAAALGLLDADASEPDESSE